MDKALLRKVLREQADLDARIIMLEKHRQILTDRALREVE